LKKSCIIIGAGLSGLTAAHELIKNNWEVTTLDKGRGVGGRMATRRTGEARFDHGAQYFSTKTADFQAFTQNIIQKNIAKKWNLQEGDKTFSHARVIGIDGMNMIPKFLAEGLNIKINEKVISISETKNGCKVITEAGNFYESDALICTTPAPQAIEILNKSNLALADIEALQSIHYQPCITVMASLKTQTNIPSPGGISLQKGNISWIADNFQKGISSIFSATIHANPVFSLAHFDDDLTQIGNQLLSDITDLIAADSIESFQMHRWRYSLASERYANNFLVASATKFPMIFAGDGFGIGSIEGAFISGKSAAQSLTINY
jgi:predicted NAD/FAD-dependent oxidoreductase